MAVVFFTGFESAADGLDGITLAGTVPAVYSTTQARTGVRSVRCTTTSGVAASSNITIPATAGWLHFGLYIATAVTATRVLVAMGTNNLALRTDRKLTYGTVGTTVLNLNQWYWIGVRRQLATGATDQLTIDGVPETNLSMTQASIGTTLGFAASAETGGGDIYIDDVIIDDAGFLAPSKVIDLLPTSDSTMGPGWTLGTGTAIGGQGWQAVNNQPPTGVADLTAGSDGSQVRNATANANANMQTNLATYASAGIGASDTVLAVQPVAATAAPVATSAKLGTIGAPQNPVIAQVNLGAGGTAGAFWSGVAAGTYPTGWKASFGTLTTSPSVTLSSPSPVVRVVQVTSSTRIAMVAYMALRVAWTPAAAAAADQPYSNPYVQLLPQ